MDQSLLIPLLATAVLGGIASHVMANRRMAKERRKMFTTMIETTAAMMDISVQIMTVEYGVELEEAIKVLGNSMEARFPGSLKSFPKLSPKAIAATKRQILKAREERAKEKSGVNAE